MTDIASIAKEELKKWSSSGWVECVRHAATNKPIGNAAGQPGSIAVAKYWRKGLGDTQRNGCIDVAWSAAFVCWCLRQAGVPLDKFPFSAGHHTYIRWAIANTKLNKAEKLFYGERVNQYAPQPGDLIAQWRKANVKDPDPAISFDSQPDDFYASHCDIVLATRHDRVVCVGGNLDNKVKQVTFAATHGILKAKKSFIAILRLKTDA